MNQDESAGQGDALERPPTLLATFGADYADYGPAYRHGSRACLRAKQPRDWPEAEAGLARTWDANKEGSRLAWEQARPAVRDAWDRLHEAPA
jgi:hypothetical protein